MRTMLSQEEKEQRKLERKIVKYNNTHREVDGIIYKQCNQHNTYFPDEDEWLPMTEDYFYKNKNNGIDGFNTYCKRCSIAKAWIWCKDPKNRESVLTSKRKRNALPECIIKVREAGKKKKR